MYFSYKQGMDIDTRDRLARTGDMSAEACAIRVIAARLVSKKTQTELAAMIDKGKSAWNNIEAGLAFPSRDLMRLTYRTLRLDFNFMMNGDWAQLPADVLDPLFAALEAATLEWDQKRNSGSTRTKPATVQPRTESNDA